ncbi:MAG TPA: helix-turn-helix domain-containing protein [Acetobacteraceae bacterium]|jgi:AraC-like DNA-binding protein|nr:helix-turn-helix domain-containing protein [Acetobacteraceae bacterium]
MLSSTTGVFREPGDLQAALREYGCTNITFTGNGMFKVRLTRIALHRLRLLSAEESLPRVAFFSIPSNTILVLVPFGADPPPLWDGVAASAGEIMTVGAGHGSHTRSTSSCRWGAMLLPVGLLLSYARKVTGNALVLPSGVCCWRPSAKAYRHLVQLNASATRVANARSGVIVTSEPARTLEHEVVDAVIACLSERPQKPANKAKARHAEIMARFEDLVRAHPNVPLTSTEVCMALDISGRTLRVCCKLHLGLSPTAYMRLRRMQLARLALRGADSATVSVSQVAAQYGFIQAGRFAGFYRAQFGELPSATLRRSSGQ